MVATQEQHQETRGIGLPEAAVGGVTLATVAGVGKNTLKNMNIEGMIAANPEKREAAVNIIRQVKDFANNASEQLQQAGFFDQNTLEDLKSVAVPAAEASVKEVRKSLNTVINKLGEIKTEAIENINIRERLADLNVNNDLPNALKELRENTKQLGALDPKQQAALYVTATLLAGLAMWGTNKVLQPKPQIQTDGYQLNGTTQQKALAAGQGMEMG